MQSDESHSDGGAALPETEPAGQVTVPPTHASQLDSPALTSTTTSDRPEDHSSTTTQPQGGTDPLKRPGEATEGAGEGDVGPAEEGTPATTARPLAARVAVDLEQASMNLIATRDAPPGAQSVAVPFQSVFAIPRPASLTSRITEPTSNPASGTNGERDSTAEEDNSQMRVHIERQLGVSTTTEQDHTHAHAHDQVLEQPPSGDSLLVLASATRSVSVPDPEDGQHPQGAGEEQQRLQHESRKRPRSAGSGGDDDDDGRETDQGSQVEATFEPFPPGWHLEGASSNVQAGGEAAASPSNTPEEGGGEDLEPASRRRRTEEPAPDPVGGETPNTMQQLDEAHEKWRQHREATLRSLQAQAMARNFTARHPPAAPPSAGPSLTPSYESYSSIASSAQAYPYGGTAPLPPHAMMGGGGGTSTFSGRTGTTATTSTQWYAKGSAAETYHVAHEQQRAQSSVQGYPAPPAAADSDTARQIGGVAPRQARSIYDSPRPPHPYTSSSSSSYYYGGVPGYVYQSTPQQQQQHQRYPSPFPGPLGHDASSPSTPAAASSTLSNVSGSKAEWSDHSSSANTTASTSVNNTSSSSSLLSRSAEAAAAGQRKPIPIRSQSNLASIMHNASPAAGSSSYSQGSEAPTPEPASSVLVGTEQGQAESQDPTSPVASGSGGGGTASTSSASTGKKPTGRRPAPANAYSINQVPGVKPFIYKLRWLLQNPQEVGSVITWSNDGSAVLVKHGGGNDAMLKQMLMRTFSHENPGAFTRQFAVYGFTQIKDPEELAEVLDPATQPADAWRAYEDERGTFHRDSLDDLDALKTMVAKKKGGSGSTTTTTTTTGDASRMMPTVQQRGQASGAGIPVRTQGIGEGTVLPSIPSGAIATATTTPAAAGGTSFPTLQQSYWPPATTTQSGHAHASSSSSSSLNYSQAGQQHQYYQHQHQQPQPQASEYVHIAPKSVGQAQAHGQVQGEGGGRSSSSSSSSSSSRSSKTEISLGGWFRQAADVPRMRGIEGLLRGAGAGAGAISTATTAAAGAGDDHQDDGGAAGDVSGSTEEEEEGSPAAAEA